MSTHRAVAATAVGKVEEIQLPTPEPGDEQVLIHVEYSSVIALDTYITDRGFHVPRFPLALGLNAAGTVAKLGQNVDGLRVGDRVVTFAAADEFEGKAMQEFAMLSKYSVAKIPDNISLPAAATIPDNLVTAYFALFDSLSLPIPSSLPAAVLPAESDEAFLIYGAGATVGHYLIQLLNLAGYHQIIATASPKHHAYLRSLGAKHVFNYSDKDLPSKILSVNNGKPIKYAVDCITAETTLKQVASVVGQGSVVSMMLPLKEGSSVTTSGKMWMDIPPERNPLPQGAKAVGTKTFTYHSNPFMKEHLMTRIIPQLLKDKHVEPTRVRLLEHGTLLERVEEALDLLRNNKISGEKVVVKL